MSAIQALKERIYDLNAIGSSLSIFGWDQQVNMPPGGATSRAEHIGILSRMFHEALVSDETQRLVEDAAGDVAEGSDEAALVRVMKRQLKHSVVIPTELAARKSKLSAEAHHHWVEARKADDFSKFLPYLEQMVDICKQEAEHLGYTDHPYDALTDQYEEGATAAGWKAMFDSFRDESVALVKAIADKGQQPNTDFLTGDWPQDKQKAFTERIIGAIGFDMTRGRQDTAPHPFCGGWSVNDIRLTTRFLDFLPAAIFGSLHEAGHGMYEQGCPQKWDRTPLCGGVSLGVHESQSRLWENIVGRSKPFWSKFLPDLKAQYPALSDLDLDTWYAAVNKVQPSLIRVEADELTYNLHIIVRFELEMAMLTGEVAPKDLPDAWNAKYESYLGIKPPSDADGCLQDVHWSGGMIGYFPTYSMGNLLSHQIWASLRKDLGDTDALIASGEFEPILTWLQDKIYSKGSIVPPNDLIVQVTGQPLDASHYLKAMKAKFAALYSL